MASAINSQNYNACTANYYAVWSKLASRQIEALKKFACREYLDCLEDLHPVIRPEAPPGFGALNKALRSAHGWSI